MYLHRTTANVRRRRTYEMQKKGGDTVVSKKPVVDGNKGVIPSSRRIDLLEQAVAKLCVFGKEAIQRLERGV